MKFWRRNESSADAAIDPESGEAFLDFVGSVLPASYGQRFQDLFGLWENDFATQGYFVEFGALNGMSFSNTYLLERLGWNGVVAEPHPSYEKLVRQNRTCFISTKCVLDRTGDKVTFHAVRGRPALSTVEGFGTEDERSHFREDFISHDVETITLDDLLDEAGAPDVIDFLSIDTEGSEVVILGAYDFERRPIRAISVEHNDRHREELFTLLTAKGYRRKWPAYSGHDDWYVHRDLERGARDAGARDRLVAAAASVEPFDNQLDARKKLLDELRG